ncbi:MAG: thymidylate synthase, partial [Betaproteobacteria bacterium]|nr:thymidylate synthase [Betaproteobacteria bacterium]
MQAYLQLLREVRSKGTPRRDRTGVGTIALFARSISVDLQQGFPLLTTKKVHFKSVKHELLWFLRGSSNVRELQQQGVSIWDEWADENGELGPVYGKQWRSWAGADGQLFDQIAALGKGLVEDPHSRRHIVSAWNVADLPTMRLAPCHILFQAWVDDGQLSLQVYQRSADLFLGVPFNIASYALLTHLLAGQAGLQPGRLSLVSGNSFLTTWPACSPGKS